MKQTRKYFEILGQLNGQTPDDYEKRSQVWMQGYMTIRSLAKKHHRLAEMDCNGYGRVRGQMYYTGSIDDYARREYGANVKSGYVDNSDNSDGTTVFTVEADKVEDKIKAIAKSIKLVVTFQGDPRGATVKLETRKGRYVPIIE